MTKETLPESGSTDLPTGASVTDATGLNAPDAAAPLPAAPIAPPEKDAAPLAATNAAATDAEDAPGPGAVASTEEDAASPTVTEVRMHLQRWRAETAATAAKLHALRAEIDANARQLENPKAAYELIDFFADLFLWSSEDFDRLAFELQRGVAPEHAIGLRQLAVYAASEQGRCLRFLDACVNKPLPYEQQRPLLSGLLATVREQLAGYKDLHDLAEALDALCPAPDAPAGAGTKTDESAQAGERTLDRRALFTRFFRR
jgi:hypothetical protein